MDGIDYSAVSQSRKRFQERLKGSQKLLGNFERISKQLTEVSKVKI